MYMQTKKKNIIICKFNLNNKCKFEEKFRFQHMASNFKRQRFFSRHTFFL